MTWFYYIHPESCSALITQDPPEVVMKDPCVIEVDREQYLRACEEWKIKPEPDPLGAMFEDLLG